MEEKIFTMDEVVKYLKIPKSTIYKLSQKAQIPSFKVGKQLRFRKSSLDKWMTEREGRFNTQPLGQFPAIDSNEVSKQTQKQVLLIDDDSLVLKTLVRFLKIYGFNVEPALSGEEALEKVAKLNFDLLITDIKMPGIDGVETIQKIREFNNQHNQPHIPEIIITGYIDIEAQTQAATLGITDYLYKPFAINDFIKAVKKKLELSDLN